jgi:LacI family transcriptional regulator
LGYEENIIAKGLKNNKTLSIGVVINVLTDVFATSIVTELETHLEANNYSLILCDYQNDFVKLEQKLEQKLEFLRSRFVDGIVIFHLGQKLPILEQLEKEGIPIVAVDSPIRDFLSDAVLVDNYQASYDVVNKLFELGHQKIGIIAGTQDRFIGRERLNGYVDATRKLGVYDPELVEV